METEPQPPAAFSVLFVCTANLCRSPMAEQLLRSQLDPRGLNWTVGSAGVQAQPGQPMHRSAALVLNRQGIETNGWMSRRLDADLVAAADLILTATELHRGAVARLDPTAMTRTFTLFQLAYLTQAIPLPTDETDDGYEATLLEQVRRARGRIQPIAPEKRDLADPMGRTLAKFRKCAALIEQSLDEILRDRPRPS